MNGLRILPLLVLVLVLTSASMGQTTDPEPLFEYAPKYTYWSDVSDGVYWWAVRNESSTVTLVSWTTGRSFPIGTIPRAAIIPEAVFPLPTVQSSLPRPWFNAFLDSPLAPVLVESTLTWSDSTSATVMVYMPPDAPMQALQNVVPEPSGLMALFASIGGLWLGMRRKLS